jgi:hypothetical protein
MSYTEDEERRLRIELMQADIENKRADTDYKRGLLRFEPWKIVIAAFAAGGIIFGALGYKIGSTPPAPIIIQQLPSPAAR